VSYCPAPSFTPLIHTSHSHLTFTPHIHTSHSHLLFTPLCLHLQVAVRGTQPRNHYSGPSVVHTSHSHLLCTPLCSHLAHRDCFLFTPCCSHLRRWPCETRSLTYCPAPSFTPPIHTSHSHHLVHTSHSHLPLCLHLQTDNTRGRRRQLRLLSVVASLLAPCSCEWFVLLSCVLLSCACACDLSG